MCFSVTVFIMMDDLLYGWRTLLLIHCIQLPIYGTMFFAKKFLTHKDAVIFRINWNLYLPPKKWSIFFISKNNLAKSYKHQWMIYFFVAFVYSFRLHFRKCIHILFGMTSSYLDSCHISIAMFSNICYHLFDCVSIEASAYNDRSNPLLWLTSHNNILDACAYWSVDPYKVQRHLINTEKKSYLSRNSNYPWR